MRGRMEAPPGRLARCLVKQRWRSHMKRIVSLVAVVVVLLTGVALAQQPPAQPKPESGHQQMQGGMCPMMTGGDMMGGSGMMRGGMMGMMGSQSDSPQMSRCAAR